MVKSSSVPGAPLLEPLTAVAERAANPDSWANLAATRRAMDRPAEAEVALRRALALRSAEPSRYGALAVALNVFQLHCYAPLAAARWGEAVLGVDPSLRTLLALLPAVNVIVCSGGAMPHYDVYCHLMSLPGPAQVEAWRPAGGA